MTPRHPFVQIDVFTPRPLAGNGRVVLTYSRSLSDDELQALARAMRSPGTIFILPRERVVDRKRRVSVRIFTGEEDLERAGFPTLGTACHHYHHGGAETINLDLRVGRVPAACECGAAGVVSGEMWQRDPELGGIHETNAAGCAAEPRVAALTIDVPIQMVSTRVRFADPSAKSPATLASSRLEWRGPADRVPAPYAWFFHFACREIVDPRATPHARMAFFDGGDLATGSAMRSPAADRRAALAGRPDAPTCPACQSIMICYGSFFRCMNCA